MATGTRHNGSGVFIADPPLTELGPLEDDPKFVEDCNQRRLDRRQQSIRNNELGCEMVKQVNASYCSLLWKLAALVAIVIGCCCAIVLR